MKASEITLAEPPPMGVSEALRAFSDGGITTRLSGVGRRKSTAMDPDQIRAALLGLVGWDGRVEIHQGTTREPTWNAWVEVCAEAEHLGGHWFEPDKLQEGFQTYKYDWRGVEVIMFGSEKCL